MTVRFAACLAMLMMVFRALPADAGTPRPERTAADVLIRNATVLDGLGGEHQAFDVLLSGGKVAAIGRAVPAPAGAVVIDGTGKWITPGIIDVHSHMGNGAVPEVFGMESVGEFSGTVKAEVWAENGIVVQDPAFGRAAAGGVTTVQILPGSGNLFGGRSVVLKVVPARTVQDMRFDGAADGLKMACGEIPTYSYNPNPHVYGTLGKAPATRAGNFAIYREMWTKAQSYAKAVKEAKAKGTKPPERNLQLETLAGVLDGSIRVHMHCHRADEMAMVMEMAKTFGYRVTAFHHAIEAYKIADILKSEGVCAAMWSDWWGYNMESYDGIPQNMGLVEQAGGCAMIHSDHSTSIQHLNQEAAKAWSSAVNSGISVTKGQAWRWLSSNPAKALGIEDRTGSLAPGLNADVVLWDKDPFSIYARAEKVFVDGNLTFDRDNAELRWVSDFELGQTGAGDEK